MQAQSERSMPKITLGVGSILFALLLAVMVEPQFAQYMSHEYAIGAAVIVALIFVVSVALHEVAHALVAHAYGARVREIALTLFGGHTTYEGPRLKPLRSMVISLAGPATNAVLALILTGITKAMTATLWDGNSATALMTILACQLAATLNWALAIFNVLPGLPMDGGRALESLFRACGVNASQATIMTGWAGRVIAVAVVAVPLVVGLAGNAVPSPLWLVWSVLIAFSLFQGASAAISHARVFEGAEMLHISHVSREIRPLENAGSVGDERSYLEKGGLYVDHSGTVLSVGVESAGAPVDFPVQAILTPVAHAAVLEGRPEGRELLSAMQAEESPAYLLRNEQGEFASVIFAEDVARALNAHE